jgi:hypothetical protein
MLLDTKLVMIDERSLRRVDGMLDNDNEHTTWQEWYLGDELVKRDAQIQLKKGPTMFGETGGIGG